MKGTKRNNKISTAAVITALLAVISLTACEALLNWDNTQAVPDGTNAIFFSSSDSSNSNFA